MKKLLAAIYGVVIGAVLCAGLLFVATLMPIPGNVQVKVVKSGSMEPAIHTGSIVAIRPAASYKVGDVITFGKDTKTQIPTTHRIIGIEGVGAQATYTTKGDANDTADQVVTRISDIRGKVLFTVPLAGYVLAFARTKLGFFLLVGIPALFVFIEEGFSIYRELRKRRRTGTRMHSVEEADEAPRAVQVHRATSVNRRKVMGAFVVLAGLGLSAAGGLWGSTISFYANAAVSQGNVLQAGVFDIVPPAPAAALFVAPPEVVADNTVQDPPPSDVPPAEPPQDTPPVEPVVEVSVSDVVIE